MSAIVDAYGARVSPIKTAPINRFDDKISSAIAVLIDICYGHIKFNPQLYSDEIWTQIFSRLSVRSLMTVRCVCKHWYVLTKGPSFTRKHLQFQKTLANDNGFFLHLTHQADYTLQEYEGFNYLMFNGDSFTSAPKSSLLFPSLSNVIQFSCGNMSMYININGPINGLYCLHYREGRIAIWNPTTIEAGFLPLAEQCIPPDKHFLCNRFLYCGVLGFGTDPLDEQIYKVILISPCYYDNGHDRTYAMLYTTRTNTWRHLKDVIFCEVFESMNNTYLNGSYYWMSHREFNVLVFDMSEESFRFITTPCNGELALHNGSLHLFDLNRNQNEIDIWVMREDNKNWLKLKNLRGFESPVVKMLGFWKTENDLLVVVDDSNNPHHTQTILYNTTTGGIWKLGPTGSRGGFKALVYYESLVSLSGEIIKYRENDNASLLGTVRDFLVEESSDEED